MQNRVLLFAIGLVIVALLQETRGEDESAVQIFTKKQVSRCKMMEASCDIEILVVNRKKQAPIKPESLLVKGNADQTVRFLEVQSCSGEEEKDKEEKKVEEDLKKDDEKKEEEKKVDKIKLKKGVCSTQAKDQSTLLEAFKVNRSMLVKSLAEEEELSMNVMLLRIKAVLIGNATFKFDLNKEDNEKPMFEHKVIVTSPRRLIDVIFDIYIWVSNSLISLLMGILLDRKSLVKIVKMPWPIFIGMLCQYLCMPLIAFSIGIVFQLPAIEALALFIFGCCPGGAASNNWTILFNGDLDLSAILTFVSTCSSLFILPGWVYSLGRVYSNKASISIPFMGLLLNLLATIVPCLAGLLIAWIWPKVQPFCKKIAKPITFVVLFSHLIMVFGSKWFMILLVRWIHWFSGPLIPISGYILGFTLAYLLRLPFRQCRTVAIETGLQNVGVAFLILFTNLPSPEADFAALPVITCSLMTNLPLFIVYGFYRLYEKCFKKKQEEKQTPEIEDDGKGKHEKLLSAVEMEGLGDIEEKDETEQSQPTSEKKERAPIYKKRVGATDEDVVLPKVIESLEEEEARKEKKSNPFDDDEEKKDSSV